MKHRLVSMFVVFALLCVCATALCANNAPGCMLKQGDRMVFLGDSITQQMIYTRYVMDFFALRYPNLNVTFRNAGWSGDRAPGALARLQRDVLDLKPTVVSICLGMNDGQYKEFDQETYDTYINAMQNIVTNLKDAGVRVVLLTPGCVDASQRKSLEGYNATLARLAEGVVELAHKEDVPVLNIYKLMLDAQLRGQTDDSRFTMIPDGVHPAPPGQALMAFGLETAMGCAGGASGLRIDAAGKTTVPTRCKVDRLKISEDAISFRRTDDGLPTYYDPEVKSVVKYAPFVNAGNSYMFTVSGLKAGNWTLTVKGTTVGTFSADELAKGVDLANKPGPWQTLAQEVDRLAKKQEDAYYKRWRAVQLVQWPDGLTRETNTLLKKLDWMIADCEKTRARAVANRTWDWSLKLTK